MQTLWLHHSSRHNISNKLPRQKATQTMPLLYQAVLQYYMLPQYYFLFILSLIYYDTCFRPELLFQKF